MSTSPDRFDHLPPAGKRVGAHRIPDGRFRRWRPLLITAVATLLVIGAGIITIRVIGDGVNFTETPQSQPSVPAEGEESPTPVPEATVAPGVEVRVLNGTPTRGLASSAIEQLARAGWSQSIAPANADSTTIERTTVYYPDPALEGAARGLAEALGAGQISLDENAPTGDTPAVGDGERITVVLGADFVPAAR